MLTPVLPTPPLPPPLPPYSTSPYSSSSSSSSMLYSWAVTPPSLLHLHPSFDPNPPFSSSYLHPSFDPHSPYSTSSFSTPPSILGPPPSSYWVVVGGF
ncbi:unnamed protein product [Boreogadus saida]